MLIFRHFYVFLWRCWNAKVELTHNAERTSEKCTTKTTTFFTFPVFKFDLTLGSNLLLCSSSIAPIYFGRDVYDCAFYLVRSFWKLIMQKNTQHYWLTHANFFHWNSKSSALVGGTWNEYTANMWHIIIKRVSSRRPLQLWMDIFSWGAWWKANDLQSGN